MSAPFEQQWEAAVRKRHISPRLTPLVERVHAELEGDPIQPAQLRDALDALLVFLSEPQGRTDANCCATDAFFSALGQTRRSWSDLPPALIDVLDLLGGALHDTIYAPHIASNFESLPEQILAKLRRIDAF